MVKQFIFFTFIPAMCSHVEPDQPLVHVHTYPPFAVSAHVPPFLHG